MNIYHQVKLWLSEAGYLFCRNNNLNSSLFWWSYIRKTDKEKENKKFVDNKADAFVVSFFFLILVTFRIFLIIIDFFFNFVWIWRCNVWKTWIRCFYHLSSSRSYSWSWKLEQPMDPIEIEFINAYNID
jgi:fatty acid desaturase